MSDYIERDKAIRLASGGCHFANVAAEIAKLPAADVRPVVHARWIKLEGRISWKCSYCEKEDCYAYSFTDESYELQDFYCPNCGAYMRGEDDEL